MVGVPSHESIRPLIYDQSRKALADWLTDRNEQPYRASQIWQGLYSQLINNPLRITALSNQLREKLEKHFLFASLHPAAQMESKDRQTKKILFRLPDERAVETVLMSYSNRRTLCVSTQAGCAMGCVFCATGQMGFFRHLTSGEIIEQVLYFARDLRSQAANLTNIVMMGMGEPFHNYDATLEAIDRLNDPDGFNFGARRFTISTVGIVPAIERFTKEKRQVNLAISLHAADDDLRNKLLPINKKYPLAMLIDVCEQYVNDTHRRISFEWALIDGVNDTLDQAMKLSGLLNRFHRNNTTLCHVNVIPLNPTQEYSGKATPITKARQFSAYLEEKGIPCTIRIRRGIDIQAGCGQLATKPSLLESNEFILGQNSPVDQ